MKGLLEGRRFGFALRPSLGNVALGLGLAATILDLGSWIGLGTRDTSALVVGAYWLCIATAVLALLALFTAVAELRDVPDEDTMLARLDAGGMLVTIVLYGASAALRSADLGAAGAAPLPVLMAIAGLLVLFVASPMSSLLYASREWEEIEELVREPHGRRRAVSR